MSRQNLYSRLADEHSLRFGLGVRRAPSDVRPHRRRGEGRDVQSKLRSAQGSTCDPTAHRCTIPVREPTLRPVEYHLSAHFPPYLVRETFDAVAQWNEALMRGRRAALRKSDEPSESLPSDQRQCDAKEEVKGRLRVRRRAMGCARPTSRRRRLSIARRTTRRRSATADRPRTRTGSATARYDPFEAPEQARKRGVLNPYDCYVKGPEDVEHPKDYADYAPSEAYAYEFVGDECALTLAANQCDVDKKKACLELGDLRYQFLTHVQHGARRVRRRDPTARAIPPPASSWSATHRSLRRASRASGTVASQFFPVLRGDAPEDAYFSGENLRGYYARLGKRRASGVARGFGHRRLSAADQLAPARARTPTTATAAPICSRMRAHGAARAPRWSSSRARRGAWRFCRIGCTR